jgi:ribosome production factor 2
MLECTVASDTARTLSQFGGPKCRVGVKPLLSFSGMPFEEASSGERDYSKFMLAKSMFVDFFRGEEAHEVDVEGLQMMISFTASESANHSPDSIAGGIVSMRVWRIQTKRSGQKLPRVEVEEMGPRVDFRIGRVRKADETLERAAFKRGHRGEVRNIRCLVKLRT